MRFEAPDFEAIEADRVQYKNAGLAPRTISSYAADWRVFGAWCEAAGRVRLPATEETIELYVVDILRRGRRVTTAERHVAGIRYEHRLAHLENPCGAELRSLLRGARRVLGQQPVQKEAIRLEDLRRMVHAIGSCTAIAARNSALLLFGFSSALRRSNLAALRIEQLTFTSQGMLVWIGHEKQDREGKGRKVAVPPGKRRTTCPVRAMQRWLEWRGSEPGPLFQSVFQGRVTGRAIRPNRIGQIVQEAAARIGLDVHKYCAHSLRAGFATEALTGGANEIMVAQQTGHRSLETLRLYLRTRDPFRGNAAAALGL